MINWGSETQLEKLKAYRKKTFHFRNDLKLTSPVDAVRFVNERAFIFFWPNKAIRFPSLWAAVAGDRPVPNNHDDPGHITWSWKDQMLAQKQWFYARLLRRRNMMVSFEALPHFYALSPNFGEYEIDYLSQYQQGKLTAESKAIYEALLYNGPMDTLSLRQASRMSSSSSSNRFQRALDQLQVEMKIAPIGISEAGAWHYAFIYDIVPRYFPDIEEKAGSISENEARAYLISKCLISLGMIELSDLRRLFQWNEKTITAGFHKLHEIKTVDYRDISVKQNKAYILSD